MPHVPRCLDCHCGSGLPSEELLDAKGIYCCRVCDACRVERMSQFRPDVFADPDYWTDEPVDEVA